LDIAGAKALKERLGAHGRSESPPASVDVPEDAPPVYHWLGVERRSPEAVGAADDEGPAQTTSLFQRLGLSFR
jgi:hypothetical protein